MMKTKTKTLVVVGTRPQLLKLSRLWADVIVNTGQHFDKDMNDIHSPKVDYNLKTTELGKMIERLEPIIRKEKPTYIIVVGDTRSTYAGAIVATHLGIPLIHIEAGMRSYENIVEERIRHMVDHVSDYCLATDDYCIQNLEHEGIEGILVGDVEFDKIFSYMPFGEAGEAEEDGYHYKPEWSNREKTPYNLLTIHRAELVDDKKKLQVVLRALEKTKARYIFPVHPRTLKQLKAFGLKLPKNIEPIKPQGHKELIRLILHAEKVVTDSGGVQREAAWLMKPVIILRTATEHAKFVNNGQAVLTGFDPKRIIWAVQAFRASIHPPEQRGIAHETIKEFINSIS